MSLWHDIRVSVRTLAKHRAFTIAALLTFATGIGATAAIATIVDAVLLRPLPYPAADRIVQVLVATAVPAVRASRIDPLVALRHD